MTTIFIRSQNAILNVVSDDEARAIQKQVYKQSEEIVWIIYTKET